MALWQRSTRRQAQNCSAGRRGRRQCTNSVWSTRAAWRGGSARPSGKHRNAQSAAAAGGRSAQSAAAVGGSAPTATGSTRAAGRSCSAREDSGSRQGEGCSVANDELGTVNHGFVGGLPEEAGIGGMVLQTMQSLDMAERKEAREVANPPRQSREPGRESPR